MEGVQPCAPSLDEPLLPYYEEGLSPAAAAGVWWHRCGSDFYTSVEQGGSLTISLPYPLTEITSGNIFPINLIVFLLIN